VEHVVGADIAAGAGAVLDNHRLAEPLLQPFGHDAGHRIDAAAGRNVNDDFDRPVRIVGRGIVRAGHRRGHRAYGNQSKKHPHDVFLPSAASLAAGHV
jgi:hypothetical protein